MNYAYESEKPGTDQSAGETQVQGPTLEEFDVAVAAMNRDIEEQEAALEGGQRSRSHVIILL